MLIGIPVPVNARPTVALFVLVPARLPAGLQCSVLGLIRC